VVGAAQSELDFPQRTGIDAVGGVDLRVLLFVEGGGRRSAEHPVQRRAGEHRRVNARELDRGRIAEAIQLVAHARVVDVALVHALGRRGTGTARLAALGRQGQHVADAPFAVEVEELGLGVGALAVDVVDDTVAQRGGGRAAIDPGRRAQGAVAHRVGVRRHVAADGARTQHVGHVVAVVVRGVQFRGEIGRIQRKVTARLELRIDQAALAVAFLFEQRGTDQARIPDVGQVRMGAGDLAARCDLGPLQQLLAVAAQAALFGKALQQHAEGIRRVLPVD
jgi:hypothetical protein